MCEKKTADKKKMPTYFIDGPKLSCFLIKQTYWYHKKPCYENLTRIKESKISKGIHI